MSAFDTNFSNQGVLRTPNLSHQGVRMKFKESEIENIKIHAHVYINPLFGRS